MVSSIFTQLCEEHADAQLEECPYCGFFAWDHPLCFRQLSWADIGVIDVGWRCRNCGEDFGFEYLTNTNVAYRWQAVLNLIKVLSYR